MSNLHSPVVNAPVYDALGTPLAGGNYLAELWGGATVNSLTPLRPYGSDTRYIIPFVERGYFVGGSVCAIDVGYDAFAWLEVRAWDARLGGTYEEAVALGQGGFGESPVFYAQGVGPFHEPPALPGPLIGLQSFSLRAIPEPSGASLFLLGGGLVRWFARRKSGQSPG